MIVIDPALPPDVQVLIKACFHMVSKSHTIENGHRISVPLREFERVRSKVKLLVAVNGSSEGVAHHG